MSCGKAKDTMHVGKSGIKMSGPLILVYVLNNINNENAIMTFFTTPAYQQMLFRHFQ